LANETGKRYFCGTCEAELVVTRGSDDGTLKCCGNEMAKK